MKNIDSNQELIKVNLVFQDIVKKKGGNKAAIGKALGGVSGQLIGQYVAGRQKPKEDFFRKWEVAYGENIRWAFETNVSSGTENKNVFVGHSEVDTDFIKNTINRMLGDRERSLAVIEEMTSILKQKYAGPTLDPPGTPGTETNNPRKTKKPVQE